MKLVDWSREVCAIVASGASATAECVAELRGRCRVAVVNNSFLLAPWADLLYAADPRWWEVHEGAKTFEGIKVIPFDGSNESKTTAKRYGLTTVDLLASPSNVIDPAAYKMDLGETGKVAHGGNSAFQLVDLVSQCGCKKQIWVGFDLNGDHWHGKHELPLRNPRPQSLAKWAKRFDANAQRIRERGIEVINSSEISALQQYQKGTVSETLDRWGV